MKLTWHEFKTTLQVCVVISGMFYLIVFGVIVTDPRFGWDFALVNTANLLFYWILIPEFILCSAAYYWYRKS